MTIASAAVIAYLLGAMPTAEWIARSRGIDLRRAGSRNPGANNAFRLGGVGVGATVLVVEVAKGASIVAVATVVAGPGGAIAAGLGAVLGNVLNPYRGFRGGQGLGITAGVLLAAVPGVGLVGIVTVASVVAVSRSTAIAALVALVAAGGAAAVPVPPLWGVDRGRDALALVSGIAVVVAPKQLRRAVRRSDRPASRGPA